MKGRIVEARAAIEGDGITGTITLKQEGEISSTSIRGQINGLNSGENGLRIYNMSRCTSIGPKFNPNDQLLHNLGNLVVNSTGIATINIITPLQGPRSVIGCIIVILSTIEDFRQNFTQMVVTTHSEQHQEQQQQQQQQQQTRKPKAGCGIIEMIRSA
ncbi:unnamed protein product [Dracunculus medinensis]|uniref:Superoxide dismutase n=1 Tax=Dracunculus medinensis TaxID=318479 RepID=A0A0N4UQU6_DRAME|nr:unnamed protein product [Dracunculus medinensis]